MAYFLSLFNNTIAQNEQISYFIKGDKVLITLTQNLTETIK